MISSLVREDLKEFVPYQIAEISRDRIRLNANESPWSLCEGELNRYPQPMGLERIVKFYQVSPEHILVTRGSNEGIDLLVRLFCQAGRDEVLTLKPTYGMYEVAAKLQGVKVSAVTLEADYDFSINMDSIIEAITPKIKIVFICSPNNPTGNTIDTQSLQKLCQTTDSRCIIVLDEAYVEFSDRASAVSLISEHSNLVILRTLSKAFGLAGVRVGIVLGNQELIQYLQAIMATYPIPTPCQALIKQAFSTEKTVQMWINISRLKNSRRIMREKLSNMSFIERVYPSEANFILIKLRDAESVAKYSADRGVLLRLIGNNNQFLRMSLGSENENIKLIEVLKEWEVQYEK